MVSFDGVPAIVLKPVFRGSNHEFIWQTKSGPESARQATPCAGCHSNTTIWNQGRDLRSPGTTTSWHAVIRNSTSKVRHVMSCPPWQMPSKLKTRCPGLSCIWNQVQGPNDSK